jgi:hypothetical protein
LQKILIEITAGAVLILFGFAVNYLASISEDINQIKIQGQKVEVHEQDIKETKDNVNDLRARMIEVMAILAEKNHKETSYEQRLRRVEERCVNCRGH